MLIDWRRLNILCIMFNSMYDVLYINDVRPVIYEGCHFIHMWKAIACLWHFTKRGVVVS